MIALVERKEGVDIPVKARPGAKRDEVLGERDGSLRLAVAATPEDGKANLALVKLLAGLLEISKSQVSLVRGASSRDKVFRVSGISRSTVAARLGSLEKVGDR